MALTRQAIVDAGLDRIELPSGGFGFWYKWFKCNKSRILTEIL